MLFPVLKSLFRAKSRSENLVRPLSPNRKIIVFVNMVDEPYFLTPGSTFHADQASMRLRVGLPARELSRRYSVYLVPVSYIEQDPSLARLGRVRAIVIGKLPVNFFLCQEQQATRLLEWIEVIAQQYRVVVDFSDDLEAAATMISRPVLATFQKRLLATCFATVTNEALRLQLAADARPGLTVIDDPYESTASGEPRLAPNGVLRLAWFGVFEPPLRTFLEAQFTTIAQCFSCPIELAFVTHANQMDLAGDMASALGKVNNQFSLRFVPWSLEATNREIEQSDLVVLPQDADSDWGRVKRIIG